MVEEMVDQCFFYGLVHPAGDGWSFDEPFSFSFLEHDTQVQTFIKYGKFHAVVSTNAKLDQNFSNDLMSVIQGLLDALGFHLGVRIRAELIGAIVHPNTLIFTTPASWPEAVGRTADQPLRVEAEELVPFTDTALREPLVRFALGDICEALVQAADTGFLCYRAVESIRQWYQEVDPRTDSNSEGWRRMRDALAVSEEELRRLGALASRRRHGGAAAISEQERIWAIGLARRVVLSFVHALPR